MKKRVQEKYFTGLLFWLMDKKQENKANKFEFEKRLSLPKLCFAFHFLLLESAIIIWGANSFYLQLTQAYQKVPS